MARPIVDGLARRLAGRAGIRRVNILTDEGRAMAAAHGVEIVPLLVAFDAQGREVLREYGITAPEAVVRALGLEP